MDLIQDHFIKSSLLVELELQDEINLKLKDIEEFLSQNGGVV